MQDPRAEHRAERRHDDGDHRGEDGTVKDKVPHALVVSGTEIFCHWDTEAGTASHTEAKDEELHTGAGADAG